VKILKPTTQTLPDGSVLELREGAQFTMDFSDATRRITLTRGTAHFSVTKNPLRPFIVSAGNVAVKAVGTAFSVEYGSQDVTVLVTEGRVSVAAAERSTKVSKDSSTGEVEPLAFVDAGAGVMVSSSENRVQKIAVSDAGDELAWPREFEDNGSKVDIYQPQIEKWDGTDFETRSAVAITPPASNEPVYGVIWMKARAEVDKAERVVTLDDINVTKAEFPSAPKLQGEYLALIRKHVPTVSKTVALDHVEASYAISEAVKTARTVPVKNDPPHIIYSTSPALLVLVDGPPVLRPMSGLAVERVINSRALIVKTGDVFYLNASGHWYQAAEVAGPWTLSPKPPTLLDAAKQAAVAGQMVDLIPAGTNAVTTTPAIYVSTVPAELIQTEGKPNLLPIEGTALMQIQNSDDALLFVERDPGFAHPPAVANERIERLLAFERVDEERDLRREAQQQRVNLGGIRCVLEQARQFVELRHVPAFERQSIRECRSSFQLP